MPYKKICFSLLGVFSIVVIGMLDYVTGYRLSFSIFYIIPVALMGWIVSRKVGWVLALFAAIIWFLADVLARQQIMSYLIISWNAFVRMTLFVIMVEGASRLKRALNGEHCEARTDHVTGIANNHAFYERAQLEIDRCRRSVNASRSG